MERKKQERKKQERKKQISISKDTYFRLLQLKVDYKVSNWNELFDILFKKLNIKKENYCLEEKLKNGEAIKLH